jgi:transcriptional/translational regulatory protein YebC/TACO1
VRTALQTAGIDYDSADAAFVPATTVTVDEHDATRVFKVIDALEDLDDVQNVYSNVDVPDDVLAAVG